MLFPVPMTICFACLEVLLPEGDSASARNHTKVPLN